MLDESLRRRLESLNRGPLPEVELAEATTAVSDSGNATTEQPSSVRPSKRSANHPGLVKPIAGLTRRGQVVENECGEHLLIELPLDSLWPGGAHLVAQRRRHLQEQLTKSEADEPTSEVNAFIDAPGGDLLFLDLETCGLAGSALFLVGLLREVEGHIAVELLLARNYAEEAAVLTSLWQRVSPATVMGTFNGKSFDWPMVLDRSTRHLLFRETRPPQPRHVDLLHHARRRWRDQFANCKLQTLETRVCGRQRGDDIPGSQIPAAYEQFVRTGFTRELDTILMHNAIDLVTLLDLTMRLAG